MAEVLAGVASPGAAPASLGDLPVCSDVRRHGAQVWAVHVVQRVRGTVGMHFLAKFRRAAGCIGAQPRDC